MHKIPTFFCLLATITAAADAQQLTVVSATSPTVGVTPDSLASVFGPAISTETVTTTSVPWPTRLGDISVVYVKDSANQQPMAGILFVSPSQMNIYIPPSIASGPATILFPTTGLGPGAGTAALRSVNVNIQLVAPGLFSAAGSGTGVAAATAVRVVIPTQVQSPVPVFVCDAASICTGVPIALGVDAPVYVSFYGTGIRGAKSVMAMIGNTAVQPLYAGPQGQYPGLDQVNVVLPIALRGSGLVSVTVAADGVQSNPVQLSIQ
jgi:uncharacterized protein (TIGR03437 family)